MRQLIFKHCGALGIVVAGISLSLLGQAQYENDDLYDYRSSERRSGVDTPRIYYNPPLPPYKQTDFAEFSDYGNKPYTPYAMVQITQAIQVGDVRLKPGYYLVKLDVVPPLKKPTKPDKQSQSANEALPSSGQNEPSAQGLVLYRAALDNNQPLSAMQASSLQSTEPLAPGDIPKTTGQSLQAYQVSGNPKTGYLPPQPQPKKTGVQRINPLKKREKKPSKKDRFPPVDPADTRPDEEKAHLSMLIKEQGRVEIVVPVYRSSPLNKKEKGSRAQLIIEPGNALEPQIVHVEYCTRNMCYHSAPLAPGLVK